MTVTTYFAAGSFDSIHYAKAMDLAPQAVKGQGVVGSGLVVSVATGTRKLAVSSGDCWQAGVYGNSDAGGTVTLPDDDPGTAYNRIDRVVFQVDWNAAAAAYSAAGGNQNVSAATAAARAAAGSIVVVKGVPAATPQPKTLTWTPGVLTQLPLARQLVRKGVGQLGQNTDNPIDERPGVAGVAASTAEVTFPGTFTRDASNPLTVTRTGGLVTFGGHVTRGNSNLGTVSAGDDTSQAWGQTAIIPDGFRPDRVVDIPVRSGGGGASTAMPTNWLQINPDGTAVLTAGIGNPITAGSLIRVATTTWKAA